MIVSFLSFLSVVIFGCFKEDKMVVPEQKVFFIPSATGSYTMTTAAVTYKIPVGLTQPLADGKTISVSISSSSTTGATEGTHYSYTKNLTFGGNKVTDTIVVTGVFNQYLSGRKDVVKFTFTDATQASASLNSSFTLNIAGPCFEGDMVLSQMLGDYNNSFDGSYGPYKTTVKSAVSTGPTTATVVIGNIYDWGWNDLTFTLDWTNPADRKLTYVDQNTGFDAGNLNSAYAGYDIWVSMPTSGSAGTFSYCNKTFSITYRRCIPGLGCFSAVTTTMAR